MHTHAHSSLAKTTLVQLGQGFYLISNLTGFHQALNRVPGANQSSPSGHGRLRQVDTRSRKKERGRGWIERSGSRDVLMIPYVPSLFLNGTDAPQFFERDRVVRGPSSLLL